MFTHYFFYHLFHFGIPFTVFLFTVSLRVLYPCLAPSHRLTNFNYSCCYCFFVLFAIQSYIHGKYAIPVKLTLIILADFYNSFSFLFSFCVLFAVIFMNICVSLFICLSETNTYHWMYSIVILCPIFSFIHDNICIPTFFSAVYWYVFLTVFYIVFVTHS